VLFQYGNFKEVTEYMANVQNELDNLRKIVADEIYLLETWETLPDVCASLGLANSDNQNGLGKAKYLQKVTNDTNDEDIVSAAYKFLTSYPGGRSQPRLSILQTIQDSLWWIKSKGIQKISNVTRFRLIESLEGIRFWGRFTISKLLETVLPNANEYGYPEVGNDGKLYIVSDGALHASVILGAKSNSVKYSYISALEYFQQLGLSNWPDERFCLLIERLLSPEIQSSEFQQKLLTVFTKFLEPDGFKINQQDSQGGLPIFKVLRNEMGVIGLPKYLIFGSSGKKPDIVIDDAVNMNIKIVRNADQCLIYDQPPPQGDLTWQMLVEWWGQKTNVDPKDDKVRQEFGFRLRKSLQSEPEILLFDTYFKFFRNKYGKNLPALIPQVYLHYDPRQRNERGKPVLVRQRMDFLLLLRNSIRVVLEIDGKQHYANDNGQAVPSRYAEMVSEDRRMRLLGYEIYRFGGEEFINSENAINMITNFFSELFFRYEIKPDHGD